LYLNDAGRGTFVDVITEVDGEVDVLARQISMRGASALDTKLAPMPVRNPRRLNNPTVDAGLRMISMHSPLSPATASASRE
jgi:hypothetical protein